MLITSGLTILELDQVMSIVTTTWTLSWPQPCSMTWSQLAVDLKDDRDKKSTPPTSCLVGGSWPVALCMGTNKDLVMAVQTAVLCMVVWFGPHFLLPLLCPGTIMAPTAVGRLRRCPHYVTYGPHLLRPNPPQ